MNIAITTSQPPSCWNDLSEKILGSGEIILNNLAVQLVKLGHNVDVPHHENFGIIEGVNYTNNHSKLYDVVIGELEPHTAFYVNANKRYSYIQSDNHWLPVDIGLFDNIDVIVLAGECLYNHYAKYIDKSRLFLIHNGYDDSLCYADESKRDKLSLCFSASSSPSCGLHVALQALNLIGRSDIIFHIYGTLALWHIDCKNNVFTPDDEYEELLQRLIGQAKYKVVVHGAVPYHKMLTEYTKHSILIHPKTHETFGCSLIEAQAAGVVPVAANVWACLDRVKHGKTGLNCQYENAMSFAEGILLLLDNDKLRQEMSRNCQEYAKNFTWRKSAQQWSDLFDTA